MGSALETLCGQAVGAGQYEMLGIYLQRSCVITLVTALFLSPLYIFTSPILKLLRQSKNIPNIAGKYALWVIPQLFAYALNFPLQKFLQAQSKVWVMAVISLLVLGSHVFLNWLVVIKLGKGLLGAAMVENISWWLVVIAQMVYVVSGFFPESWTGLSLKAFKSLSGFVKLSLASAIMLCLELWYYTVVILMVGWLKNPEIAVDAISIWYDYSGHDQSSGKLLAFPEDFPKSEGNPSLMVLNESLAMVRYPECRDEPEPREIEIWVMKQYGEKDSWTKQFVIGPYMVDFPFLFLNDEWLLVESNCQLAVCALEGNQFKGLPFYGIGSTLSAVVYEESLISLNDIILGDP